MLNSQTHKNFLCDSLSHFWFHLTLLFCSKLVPLLDDPHHVLSNFDGEEEKVFFLWKSTAKAAAAQPIQLCSALSSTSTGFDGLKEANSRPTIPEKPMQRWTKCQDVVRFPNSLLAGNPTGQGNDPKLFFHIIVPDSTSDIVFSKSQMSDGIQVGSHLWQWQNARCRWRWTASRCSASHPSLALHPKHQTLTQSLLMAITWQYYCQ